MNKKILIIISIFVFSLSVVAALGFSKVYAFLDNSASVSRKETSVQTKSETEQNARVMNKISSSPIVRKLSESQKQMVTHECNSGALCDNCGNCTDIIDENNNGICDKKE